MKIAFCAVAALALLGAGAADATVFAGTANLTDTTSGNRLNVTGTPNPASFSTGNLTAGQTSAISDLMTLNTTFSSTAGCGGTIFGGGCTSVDNINLAFTFTTPGTITVNQGGTATENVTTTFLFGTLTDGSNISWNGSNGTFASQVVNFTNGASARLDVYDTDLTGSGTSLSGTVRYRIRDLADPRAVPEPATWAMMIVGFGATGAAMRRRRSTNVRFA